MQINILSFTIVRRTHAPKIGNPRRIDPREDRPGRLWRGCKYCGVTIWRYEDGDVWYDHKQSPWCDGKDHAHYPAY